MSKVSYRFKLMLILLGLVVALQASSYIATRVVIRDAVVEEAYRELERGSELFSQLMQTRAQQLAQSVSVLTDDFGFKEAVATADRATIRSVLVNHAARIQADMALVLDDNRQLVASSMNLPAEQYQLLRQLEPVSVDSGSRYSLVVINGTLYQFVLSPIMAPLQIGTAGIGFEIDETLSAHLQKLTDLEVSFVADVAGQPSYLSGTLTSEARNQLMAEKPFAHSGEQSVWRAGDMLNSVVVLAQTPQLVSAVLQVPLAHALKPFAVLDTQLLTLAFSFFVGAGLIAMFLARSVTRPVRELAGVARKIADGHYGSPVRVYGGDEFTDLAQAFTRMQTAIAEREQEILYQAEHDSLTDLANRSQVFPRLHQTIDTCQAAGQQLVVMVVDIYKFTQINDTLSPETGDRVLRAVGGHLEALVGEQGRALRLGSDEFLLLMPVADAAQALEFTEQVVRQFDRTLHLDETDIKIELNMGYAVFPEQGESAELLLRRANLALNQARQSHEFVCRYRSGWDEDHLRRLQLFADFKQALLNDEISLYYQPKIDPRQREHVGAEALIRWVHPEFGFVNPEEFIAVIESAGQISLLTRWVIRTAVKQVQQLRAQGIELTMSVNLSALDLLEDDLHSYISKLLHEHELPSCCLCLEITESAIMQEAERSMANIQRLHELGLLISIDDYGTGYSSLSQMKRLPVTELKIDKSFVLDLDSNEDDRQIVKSTIELGHTLGLSVTAEGVETEQSRDWLVANGCDILQGYLYSKPVPAREFGHWLERYLREGDI